MLPALGMCHHGSCPSSCVGIFMFYATDKRKNVSHVLLILSLLAKKKHSWQIKGNQMQFIMRSVDLLGQLLPQLAL